MIAHATDHPLWNPSELPWHYVSEMASELLGFGFGLESVAQSEAHAWGVGQLAGLFEAAANRWLSLPPIAEGFSRFLIRPAAHDLMLRGVIWLHDAAVSFDHRDWANPGLQQSLIEVLRASWGRHREEVAQDEALRKAFLGLLTLLAAQGSPAAAALAEQVLSAIKNG
jgi:hypothetical protein